MQKVITRFAPSPTGYIHVGNIRTALFPWLLAKQDQGKFILRIEDTDQARYVEGSIDLIIETLNWLGLSWDEGYEVGGAHGPYMQSERKEIYYKYAQMLINKGLAYADPYSKEELDNFRGQAAKDKKPFLYRDFRPTNPPKWDGSQPLRLKVADPKRTSWDDLVMGHLTAGPEAQDDFIIIKSDGMPTYNFAHIVDDYEMGVNLIVRGTEFVSSTPKYLSLYEALGINPPLMASVPHIMNPDGRKKLGKRDGAISVTQYREMGVLSEAMVNFLASLGWNDGTEQEIYSIDELINKFDLSKVQKSGARFDEQKLIWINGQWIKKLDLEELYNRCQSFWPIEANDSTKEYKLKVLKVSRERMKLLSDLNNLTQFFFVEPIINIDLINEDKMLSKLSSDEKRFLIEAAINKLDSTEFFHINIQKSLNELLIETSSKPATLFSLIRISTTWSKFSPGLAESLEILGKEVTLERLKKASQAV